MSPAGASMKATVSVSMKATVSEVDHEPVSAEFSVYHADVDNSWEGEVVNHLLNLLFFSHPISILIRFMIAVNAFQVRF